jgi:hypothetical protein
MKLDVTIDRLVLDRLDPRDRHDLAGALTTELTRLLAEPSFRTKVGSTRHLLAVDAGTVALDHGLSPTATGRALAGAVHRALCHALESPASSDGGAV